MNNDLISRKELRKAFKKLPFFTGAYLYYARQLIDNAPTINTTCPHCDSGYAQGYSDGYLKGKEERPHGEWIGDTDYDNTCKCSKCRMTFDTDRLKMVMCDGKYELPPCCPNCGAKMDGMTNKTTAERPIRCKDCKYQVKEWKDDRRMKEKGYWIYGCKKFGELMGYWGWGGNDNEYCSDAEPRGGANDGQM